MTLKSFKKLVACMLFLGSSLLVSQNIYGQCEGPKNMGDAFMLDLLTNGSAGTFDISGIDVTISFNSTTGKIEIIGSGDMKFHTDGSGNIVRLGSNTAINQLTNFEAGPAIIYDLANNTGAFGGGVEGFIGIVVGDRFGYIELKRCGATTCGEYVLNIDNAGLSAAGSAITGNCASLNAVTAPIPTMSEWGLIIFGLLVLNISVFFLLRLNSVQQTL